MAANIINVLKEIEDKVTALEQTVDSLQVQIDSLKNNEDEK